jgi:hypothetical protein
MGDPESVRRAAFRARSLAAELRADARRTASLAEVEWVSVEADRWRGELDGTVAAVYRDADAADALADALLDHAAAVERTLASIAAARQSFLSRLEDARRVLGRAADEVSEAAITQARAVVDRATRMPGQGSLDWLRF